MRHDDDRGLLEDPVQLRDELLFLRSVQSALSGWRDNCPAGCTAALPKLGGVECLSPERVLIATGQKVRTKHRGPLTRSRRIRSSPSMQAPDRSGWIGDPEGSMELSPADESAAAPAVSDRTRPERTRRRPRIRRPIRRKQQTFHRNDSRPRKLKWNGDNWLIPKLLSSRIVPACQGGSQKNVTTPFAGRSLPWPDRPGRPDPWWRKSPPAGYRCPSSRLAWPWPLRPRRP